MHFNKRTIFLTILLTFLSTTSVFTSTPSGTATPAGVSANTSTTISSTCLGEYVAQVPDSRMLDASTVTDKAKYNPANCTNGWLTFDHTGKKDEAYAGVRHIAKRDTGMQWFGYSKPQFNDMILRYFGDAIESKGGTFDINIKQAPVRADWHTINGSGMVFGVHFYDPSGKEVELTDPIEILGVKTTIGELMKQPSINETLLDSDISSEAPNYENQDFYGTKTVLADYSFDGYAFVATSEKNQLRYYPKQTIESFMNGAISSENSEEGNCFVLYETDKKCNSQSLTANYDGETLTLKIGKNTWYTTKMSDLSSAASSAGISIPTSLGMWAGAMVDYRQHNCDSLSSVFMFNYTFNQNEYY